MATFLLVHGAWHGAWCWDLLVPELEALGHRVRCVDLPGHGFDRTPRSRVTLPGYSQAVCDTAAGAGGQVIAVGHSMGGFVITKACSDMPRLFSGLVYLTAFVPQEGESIANLARRERESRLRACASFGPLSVGIKPGDAASLFFGTCKPETADWAARRLCRQPVRPLLHRLRKRREIEVPRSYIECTRDCAMSLSFQRAMQARAKFARIVSMDTDHSPFLSAPGQLAQHLSDLAEAD